MNAVERTRAKVRTWERNCRGFIDPRPRVARICDIIWDIVGRWSSEVEGEGCGRSEVREVRVEL